MTKKKAPKLPKAEIMWACTDPSGEMYNDSVHKSLLQVRSWCKGWLGGGIVKVQVTPVAWIRRPK